MEIIEKSCNWICNHPVLVLGIVAIFLILAREILFFAEDKRWFRHKLHRKSA